MAIRFCFYLLWKTRAINSAPNALNIVFLLYESHLLFLAQGGGVHY
jgi:hypothetical protein